MTASAMGGLPQFLGLGTQKGGTTTLQLLLEQHPQVWLSPRKELQFFSLHYGLGEVWYRQQFAAAAEDQWCGDITPYYLFHPQAPARIANLLPAVKMMVLLRDPVDRCLSQYFHSCRLGLESLPLEQALAAEQQRLAGAEAVLCAPDGCHRSHQEHSYLARSRYEQQLRRYEHWFSPDQLLLLRSEDLFQEPQRSWDRVLDYLELDRLPLPPARTAANAGAGEAAAVDPALRGWLREQLDPTYQAMEQGYGIRW
jgi:hypothetical protein